MKNNGRATAEEVVAGIQFLFILKKLNHSILATTVKSRVEKLNFPTKDFSKCNPFCRCSSNAWSGLLELHRMWNGSQTHSKRAVTWIPRSPYKRKIHAHSSYFFPFSCFLLIISSTTQTINQNILNLEHRNINGVWLSKTDSQPRYSQVIFPYNYITPGITQ